MEYTAVVCRGTIKDDFRFDLLDAVSEYIQNKCSLTLILSTVVTLTSNCFGTYIILVESIKIFKGNRGFVEVEYATSREVMGQGC